MIPDFTSLTARGQVRRLRRLGMDVLSAWDVRPIRVSLLQYYRNATFRVDCDDGQTYVLRMKRIDSAEEAWGDLELRWLRALQTEEEIVAPHPLALRGGMGDGIVVAPPGAPFRYRCMLLSWVTGRSAGSHPTPILMERAGALMARLHVQAERWRPPALTYRWNVDGVLGPAMGIDGKKGLAAMSDGQRTVIAEVSRRSRTVMTALGEHPAVYGIIHGDLHLGNCLFRAGQAGAIDFETCGGGLYAYDVAVMFATLYRSEDLNDLRQAFLHGYSRARLPNPEELAAIDTLMCARIMGHAVWQAALMNEPTFGERARERVRMQVAWLERALDASASSQGR